MHTDPIEGSAPPQPAVGVHGGGTRRDLQAIRQDRQLQMQRRRARIIRECAFVFFYF